MMSTTSTNGDGVTTLETNTGGRVRFAPSEEVRVIRVDGSLTKEVYQVEQERSDRRGYVGLREKDGTRTMRVHHRRVLPVSVDGKAVVIETGDKFWACCPECGHAKGVSTSATSMECPKCAKAFELHWLGVKPMSDTATKAEGKAKTAKTPKPDKAKTPKTPRPAREPKEPTAVNLHQLAGLGHCELWTKKNVKFDHERMDVQAHCLLYTGDSPRKLCFNTYNGALGKKAPELPIDAFIANKSGNKKETKWFPVADLDKQRTQLGKSGYEKQKK
jgi:hypothetical protein